LSQQFDLPQASSRAGSVIQMEIQQMPMINKPEKTDATDRQQGVPDFVP
jgi:hypothetical protein